MDKTGFGEQNAQGSPFFEGGEPNASVSVNTTSSELYAPLPPSETQEVINILTLFIYFIYHYDIPLTLGSD